MTDGILFTLNSALPGKPRCRKHVPRIQFSTQKVLLAVNAHSLPNHNHHHHHQHRPLPRRRREGQSRSDPLPGWARWASRCQCVGARVTAGVPGHRARGARAEPPSASRPQPPPPGGLQLARPPAPGFSVTSAPAPGGAALQQTPSCSSLAKLVTRSHVTLSHLEK